MEEGDEAGEAAESGGCAEDDGGGGGGAEEGVSEAEESAGDAGM